VAEGFDERVLRVFKKHLDEGPIESDGE
jgi:hypothetical protein